MADEYCSTPARALSLVLPPKGRPRTELWAARTEAPLDGERLTGNQRALLLGLPRVAGGDLSALRRLESRGLVTIAPRARRRAPAHPRARRPGGRAHGRAGGRRRGGRPRRRAPAARRHRLRQDRGLPARRGGGARARRGRDRARARDRAHAADRRALPGALRRHGRAAALGARGGRALRRVAPAAHGRGADRGRPALGGVRARARPGPDRRRRGARPSYKHEGDPRYDARHVAAARARLGSGPLRCAPSAVAENAATSRNATGLTPALVAGCATPRPETWHALSHLTLSERVGNRPLPPVRVLDMRGARHPLHPDTRRALTEARKAILLLNRRGWSNFLTCRTCGKVWECPQCDVALVLHRAEHAVACHHCGHRERVPDALRRVRLAVGRPLRRRHRAAGGGARRRARRPGVPARRRHVGRQGRRAGAARALRRRAGRAARRHADGREGPRLPGRHARRRRRRRLDAALPGLPRRGADVRADRPAGRASGARAAGRPRAGADDRARRAGDRRRGAARHARLRRRASSPAGARSTTRRSPT